MWFINGQIEVTFSSGWKLGYRWSCLRSTHYIFNSTFIFSTCFVHFYVHSFMSGKSLAKLDQEISVFEVL